MHTSQEGGLGPNFDALFLAGERTDPTTVKWLQEAMPHIPVIDHYWQTEFGCKHIAPCGYYGFHCANIVYVETAVMARAYRCQL